METNDISILPDRAEYLCKWPFVKRARATILAAAPTQPSLFDTPFYLVGTVASGSFLENSHNRDRRLARRATMRGFKVRAPNSQLARKIYYEAKR